MSTLRRFWMYVALGLGFAAQESARGDGSASGGRGPVTTDTPGTQASSPHGLRGTNEGAKE